MDMYRAESLAQWLQSIAQEEVNKVKSLEEKMTQVTGKKIKARVKKELETTTAKAEKLCSTIVTTVYNTHLH